MDICFGMVCFDETNLPLLILCIIFIFAMISAVLWRYNHMYLQVPKHKDEQPLCDHRRYEGQADVHNVGGANIIHDPCPRPPRIRRSLVDEPMIIQGDTCPTPDRIRRSSVSSRPRP